MQAVKLPAIIPTLLVALRVLLGPTLIAMTIRNAPGVWLLVLLIAALLSDILDGIVARRLGVATERLRVADSWADGWFYLWVCAAVWFKAPEIIRAFRVPIIVLLSMDLFGYAVDLVKYRRITSLHAYSAKAWGIALFIATVALLVYHTGGVFLWMAIVLGYVCNLEGLAIKILLPTWQTDVHSVFHALKMRRTLASIS
jgi:CDP-diacylglycerol--glycerol-3-phosphate 3-phosphatidyltransferase